MSTGKRGLLKNILSLGAIQVINYVFPLISVPVISRILGPDKFGIISYSATFIIYFTMLITYGFDLTATRKLTKAPLNTVLRNRIFSEVLIAKSLLFFLSVSIFIICLYKVPLLAADKRVAIFSFLSCISVVFTQNWIFQAMQDLHKIAVLNFFSKLIFTVLILIMIKEKRDYFWQPLLASTTQILFSAISFFWAYKRYSLTFIKTSYKQVSQLLWSERTVFLSMVVISLYTTTNTVTLGLLKNETEVGYYTAAQRLTDVAGSIISLPLAQALFPYIGAAFGESNKRGIAAVQSVSPLIIIFTLFITLVLLVAGPFVLIWFYGNSFLPSVPVFRILSFVPLITIMSNVFGIQIMLNLGMDKPFFYITAVGAVIGSVLNILMVKTIGYTGAAWNWIIVEIYINVTLYIFIRKKGIQPFLLHQFSLYQLKKQLQPISKRYFQKKINQQHL